MSAWFLDGELSTCFLLYIIMQVDIAKSVNKSN